MTLEVKVRNNNVEKAIRQLKKKVMKEGILKEIKMRQYYEKPTLKHTHFGQYVLHLPYILLYYRKESGRISLWDFYHERFPTASLSYRDTQLYIPLWK